MLFNEVQNCRGHPHKILVNLECQSRCTQPRGCCSILSLFFAGSMAKPRVLWVSSSLGWGEAVVKVLAIGQVLFLGSAVPNVSFFVCKSELKQ